MAIAVFGDIHGNLEALEAIIKHIKKNRKIKQIYFLGDAITFGSDSSACLKLLKANSVRCVLGNHEQRMVRYDESITTKTYLNSEHIEYVFNSLDQDDLNFIRTMKLEEIINYKGFKVAFTHYAHSPTGVVREERDEFSERNLTKLFAYLNADVVFFGHIHTRKVIIDESGRSYICNGPSGCVKGHKTYYTYFDVNRNMGDDPNFDIYRIDINFNRRKFIDKLEASSMPQKNEYMKFCYGVGTKEKEK
jgi:predicted phosphodiesterase